MVHRACAERLFSLCLCSALACRPDGSGRAPEPVEPPPKPLRAADYAHLLPPELTLVMGMDVAALQRTAAWDNVMQAMQQNQEFYAPLAACELGPEAWHHLLFGMVPPSDDEQLPTLVMVIDGDDVGTPQKVECLVESTSQVREKPLTPTPDGLGYTAEGAATLYPISADALVLTTNDVAADVRARMDQGGPSVFDDALQSAAARTDMEEQLWVVGTMPDLPELSPGIRMQNFSGSFNFDHGMRVSVALGVDTPESAATAQSFFVKQLPYFMAVGGAMGVPKDIFERTEIGTRGNAVTMDGSITPEEFEEIQAQIEASRP